VAKLHRIAVIGQGYVGLPLAIATAESGLQVTGIDIDRKKVERIQECESPVEDISNQRIQAVTASGNFSVTTEFAKVSDADVVVICVPTPLDGNLEPDLTALKGAVIGVVPFLKDGTLIISESTSYPGTLRNVIMPLVKENYAGIFSKLHFASAPERVNPGDLKWDIKNTPRLVGGIDAKSTELANEFYSNFCAEVVITETPEVAEAAKILENTFRLVNIALLNELNKVFSINGIDTNAVVDAASTKPYGYMPFRSGVGIGGHCIPVDPMYLTWWARQTGSESRLVELADSVSRSMPIFVAEKAISIAKSEVKKVLVLGVAYKPGVSDTRETPVLELVKHLVDLGKEVAWHDPLVTEWNGTNGVEITWECQVAILATNQPGIEISTLTDAGVPVLDCTNSHRGKSGVVSL
jgi:UDP-N-acetyl-D-glucosamine dehydrogenase